MGISRLNNSHYHLELLNHYSKITSRVQECTDIYTNRVRERERWKEHLPDFKQNATLTVFSNVSQVHSLFHLHYHHIISSFFAVMFVCNIVVVMC